MRTRGALRQDAFALQLQFLPLPLPLCFPGRVRGSGGPFSLSSGSLLFFHGFAFPAFGHAEILRSPHPPVSSYLRSGRRPKAASVPKPNLFHRPPTALPRTQQASMAPTEQTQNHSRFWLLPAPSTLRPSALDFFTLPHFFALYIYGRYRGARATIRAQSETLPLPVPIIEGEQPPATQTRPTKQHQENHPRDR
jgi:hypothetical protein